MFASHLASPAEQPQRDLACADLWERSLERSRRRREVAALHRKHAPRRKGVSLAMSAALLASPMAPIASAASGGNGSAPTEETGSGDAEGALAGDAILRRGDTGAAVAAVQGKLGVDDDGIFGPITEGAVEAFQGRTGLPVTGEVDARTWTELFRAAVSFGPQDTPAAQAIQASASAKPVAGGAAEDDTTPVETQEGDRPRVASDSPPIARAASAQPEPEPASAATSSDEESDSGEERNEGRSDRRASSRGGSGGGSSDGESEVDGSEGGSRPVAGVNRQSDTDRDRGRSDRRAHDHRAEKSDRGAAVSEVLEPVVTAGGDCATGRLATPTRGVRTSGFGDGRNHAGIDIGAPMGTAVNAALCGTVTMAGVQGGYGNIVCIRHTSSFSTCYAHLSSINTRTGAYVKVGQLIGRVGSTGRSTGPHLHFETRVNGRGEDPDQYLKGGKRVPGGGSEARAASSSDSQRASTARRGSGSTQSTSSSSQYASAPSQQGSGSGAQQEYGTGGSTPPNGTASQPEQQAAPAEQQAAPAEQQAAPAEQQAAPAEQQAAPAEQQAAPAEQQAAPAEQQAAPAEQHAESSSEATVTAEATTPEPEAATSPEASAEEPAEPAEEPAVEAEVAVETPAADPEPAPAAPADEAEPAAEEPAVEEPVVEADAAVEPAAAVEASAAEVAPEAVEAPAVEVAPEATVEAPAVEVAPEAAVEATTPAPAG